LAKTVNRLATTDQDPSAACIRQSRGVSRHPLDIVAIAAAGSDMSARLRFRDLVAARIIEPTSKIDALRVLEETGVESAAYRTLKRRLAGLRQTRIPASTFGCARHMPGWGRPAWCCMT